MHKFKSFQQRIPVLILGMLLANILFLLGAFTAVNGQAQTTVTVPVVEFVEEEDVSLYTQFTEYLINFLRRANAEVATHMKAIEKGEDLGAFFLGLAVAFVYGMVHAFGPGHGKFIIVSYFLGREVRVRQGLLLAAQMSIVHVIAAIIIVWLADVVLKAGFGIGLTDVPGVRAGSFLIIVGIGLYMLYQAVKISRNPSADIEHGHSHGHGHGHSHGHSHSHGGSTEGGILALAAGMVPCPGAVLVMLYAVANDMIYPGFILVASMSVGIGLSISVMGVSAIIARQTVTRILEKSGGSNSVNIFRSIMNYTGAIFVTLIGLVSFVAFLDIPL